MIWVFLPDWGVGWVAELISPGLTQTAALTRAKASLISLPVGAAVSGMPRVLLPRTFYSLGATLASWHGGRKAGIAKQKLQSPLIPGTELALAHIVEVKTSREARRTQGEGK